MLNKDIRRHLGLDDVALLPGNALVDQEPALATRVAATLDLTIPVLGDGLGGNPTQELVQAVISRGGMPVLASSVSLKQVTEIRRWVRKGALPKDLWYLAGGDPPSPSLGAYLSPGPGVHSRARALVGRGVDLLLLVSTHANSPDLPATVAKLKERYPGCPIGAGGVTEAETVMKLCDAGVDAILVGEDDSRGADCLEVSGVGAPIITAVDQCARAAESYDVGVAARAPLNSPGDLAKLIAAGAHSVVLDLSSAVTESAPPRFVGQMVDWLMDGLGRTMRRTGCATVEELRRDARFCRVVGE